MNELEYSGHEEIRQIIDEIIDKIESDTSICSISISSRRNSISSLNTNYDNLLEKKIERRGRKKNPNILKEIHQCSECEFNTEKRLLLKKHFILKHSDKIVEPFKCEFCEKVFKDPGQLSNHRNVHIGLKPFKCNECELNFTTKGELIRHTRYKHTLERPHKCSYCDYSSVELSKLKRHIRVHTGERPYLCPYCDYASRDTFKLKRHLRIHTGEKPYECPVCKHSFSQSNSLKVHMKKNHPDIPSTIAGISESTATSKMTNSEVLNQQIEASSISSSTLNQEESSNDINETISQEAIIIDETTEIFECKECCMKFLTSKLLSEHMVEHTGERPYSCEICGVKFTHKFALRSHTLSHNADYSENLKEKLRNINRATEIANTNIPIEVKVSQENSSYKKSIRNMMGLKEEDDTVKDTFKEMVEKQKLKSKQLQEKVEIIKKKDVEDESIRIVDDIIDDIVSVSKQKEKENDDSDIDDEKTPETENNQIKFRVGQNKRKIQHAENSFVNMNETKKLKLDENKETNENKTSLDCKKCSKKYASESNLKRHMKQAHKDATSDLIKSPPKPIKRDDFLSHLNATASATSPTKVVENKPTDSNNTSISEEASETNKKPTKIKSIYDKESSEAKHEVNFTPISKAASSTSLRKSKSTQQLRSHLAREDKEDDTENNKVEKRKPKETKKEAPAKEKIKTKKIVKKKK